MKVSHLFLLTSLLVGLAQATGCSLQEGKEVDNGQVSRQCTFTEVDEENEQEASLDEENEQEAAVDEENEQEAAVDEENEQEVTMDEENEQEAAVDEENEQEVAVDEENEEEADVDEDEPVDLLNEGNEQEVALENENEQETADVMDGDKLTVHVSGPIGDAVDHIATFSQQIAGAIGDVIPAFPGTIGDVLPDVPGVPGDVIPVVPIRNVAHLFTKTTTLTRTVMLEVTTISTCYKDNENIPDCPPVRRTVASFHPVDQTATMTSAQPTLLTKTGYRRRRSQEGTHTPQMSDIYKNTGSTSITPMPTLESSLVSTDDEPMEVEVPIRAEKAVGLLTRVTEIKMSTITQTVPHPEFTVKLALEGCRPAAPVANLCEDMEENGTGEEINDVNEENGEEFAILL